MTYFCLQCGFEVAATAEINGEHCANCGSLAKNKTASSEKHCVKCGHLQVRSAAACDKCGLRFDLQAHFVETAARAETNDSVSRMLNDRWTHIAKKPNDIGAHRKFIDLCHASGRIDFAGSQYKSQLTKDDVINQEVWRRHLDHVVSMALLSIPSASTTSTSNQRTFSLFMLILGALLILGLALLYYLGSSSSSLLLHNHL